MKKITLLAIIIVLSTISTYAISPLNETFESFTISATSSSWIGSNPAGFAWNSLGSTGIQVVANPNKSGINTSNQVLQINRNAIDTLSNNLSASSFAFRGTFSSSYSLPMTATNCIVQVKLLKTVSGTVGIRLLPNASLSSSYTRVTVNVNGSPDWQTVQFNFSALVFSTITATPMVKFEIETTPTVTGQKGALTVWIDDINIISNATNAIKSIGSDNQIVSYIDPSTSMLILQNLPSQSCVVKVFNLSGVECKRIMTNSTSISTNLSSLKPGIYIISCYSNAGKIYTDKVIKW